MAKAADAANLVGRLLVGTGLLVLSFAVFQLWGTGLAEAQAQDDLQGQFDSMLANIDQTSDGGIGTAPEAQTEIGVVNEAQHTPLVRQIRADQLPDEGEAAGRIYIPALDVEKTIVHGVSRDDLRLGPGHYPATPWPGQQGNAAIAGHRTTHGAPFLNLDRLSPGDDIFVHTVQGVFHYQVQSHEDQWGHDKGHFIVDPYQVDVLDDFGDNRLTLTACHPRYSAAQRLIVTAELVSEPAPTLALPDPGLPAELVSEQIADPAATDETANSDLAYTETETEVDSSETAVVDDSATDVEPSETYVEVAAADQPTTVAESLGWQPQHWPTTAMWAALTASIFLAGLLTSRRWRRWPAYAATAGPFLYCLFWTFTYLDKMLPAV